MGSCDPYSYIDIKLLGNVKIHLMKNHFFAETSQNILTSRHSRVLMVFSVATLNLYHATKTHFQTTRKKSGAK